MNYNIVASENFQSEAKRLVKKYSSLRNELKTLEKKLLEYPALGTPIGHNAYKIRLAVKSKGKGKSGGLRVITYFELDYIINDLTNIFLLSIYDKSETENITKSDLARHIKNRMNKGK